MAHYEVATSGLTFPEGPRWYDGKLWFSDFYSRAVYTLDAGGALEKVVDVPGQPSGLGFMPNGDLLISSMRDQKVLRFANGALSLHSDLSALVRYHCNDMIVLSNGRAYVGNFGFDPHSEEPRTTTLVKIEPDGSASIVASDMAFPNGMATLDDERVLIVAESVAQHLTAFDIGPDGTLANRRVIARTPECQPDGICIDANGDILVTTMVCNTLVTFARDGTLLRTDAFDTHLWAVAVGGGATWLCTSDHYLEAETVAKRTGRILRLTPP